MREYKTQRIVLHVIFFVMLNFIGKMIAEKLQLPVWLDALGTIFAAYEFGPFCGAIIGGTANIIFGAIDPLAMYYVIVNVAIGYLSGVFIKKGYLKDAYKLPSMSMVVALVSFVLSSIINLMINNGLTGNLWGDSVIGYMTELGMERIVSCFVGEFYVDLLDKLISIFVVFLIIKFINKFNHKKSGHNRLSSKQLNAMMLVVVMAAGLLYMPSTNAVAANDEKENKINFSEYVQIVYSNTNGIPGGAVSDIEQTMDGMIWVGTYGGLYQFDGHNFKLMSEYDSVKNVNCLYTDEEGRLWIGTNDNGLSICSKNQIVNILDENGGLSADSVRSVIKSSNGIYYVGTTKYLNLVKLTDGVKTISEIEKLSYVNTLVADTKGNVCAVTNDGKLAILNGEEIIAIKEKSEKDGVYTSAFYNSKNELFAATSNAEIEVYKSFDMGKKPDFIISCEGIENINEIKQIDGGNYLVCSDNGIGYISFDNHFEKINTNSFDSSIDNIMKDYQGNYWFSSSRLGLLKLTKSTYTEVYSRICSDENVINSVIKWNDTYYFGTDNGLVAADEALLDRVDNELTQMLEKTRIRCLKVDSSNHLWIATSGLGVIEAYDDKYINYKKDDGLIGDKTRSILELSDKSIAISTDNGISIIEGEKVKQSIGINEGFITPRTLCMYEKEGILYAGTDGSGIAVIKDGKVIKTINKADGLGSNIILRIVESSDKNMLIILTGTGIVTLDNNHNVNKITTFPYYNNFDAYITKEKNVWVLCSAGIYVVKEEELLNNEISHYELLDTKKGLRQSLTANAWNYIDENNNFYLCGDKGVVATNIYDYENDNISYRMELESIIIDGVITHIDKEESNSISRDATKLEFCPKVLNYKMDDPYVGVWLEGFDAKPKIMLQSELKNQVYTNLKSGEYTFHLMIYDTDKKTVLEENTYSLIKEKEFYDNWWFSIYIFLVLTVVIVYVVWLLFGSQINKTIQIQKKELENLKLKQTADAALAASEAKNNFLALMSHDIRTPINAILGLNELVIRESKEEHIYEYAKDIKSAGGTLLTLVNSILDFSKIEEGKMEIVPVRYMTRTLLNNLITGVKTRAESKNLEFIVEVDSNIPCELYGDDVRITQVISNLLTNAIKYTNEGYVKLVVKEMKRDASDSTLYVEVTDSGIGIKPEDREKLFESFVRLDEEKNHNIEGTGLGMSIVVNLLGLMGGKLNVESEYGKGSTFSFILRQKIMDNTPVGDIEKEVGVVEDKKEIKHIYVPNAKVLVVDDNNMNIIVAEGLLRINGIKPDTATNGKAAIEMISNNHYDIVFLDHMMPEMDGIETLEYITKHGLKKDDTKIIILTANAIAGAKEKYLEYGFDDYLSKPIDVKELEDKLQRYIPERYREEEISKDSEEDKIPKGSESDDILKENEATMSVENKENADDEHNADSYVVGEGIDENIGLRYCMDSWEFYIEIMKEYINSNKVDKLNELFANKDYKGYEVQIHAAKSNSMNIGAVALSQDAKALEFAAKDNDIDYIKDNHARFIREYQKIIKILEQFLTKRGEM